MEIFQQRLKALAYKAFLSSPSEMISSEGQPPNNGIRAKARNAFNKGELFIAETDRPGLNGKHHSDLEIATELMQLIRSSDVFICLLLGASRGSPLRISAASISTTFFELEIFQSIVLDKPTYLLVHESFSDEDMRSYFELLSFAFPSLSIGVVPRLSERQTISAIREIVSNSASAQLHRIDRTTDRRANFHSKLLETRDPNIGNGSKPQTQFLDLTRYQAKQKNPDLDRVRALDREREAMATKKDASNDRKMAISWLQLRELSKAKLIDANGNLVERDQETLGFWNRALGDWHSAAAWGGLHSHIYLGTIPTLRTQTIVRATLLSQKAQVGSPITFPGGAYASSYYSLSKMVRQQDQRAILELSMRMLLSETGPGGPQTAGENALMGSIVLATGAAWDAKDYYRAAMARYEAEGDTRAVGQMLCELSYATLRTGNRREAGRQAVDGISIMLQEASNHIDGFLVRAMLKSAFVQLLSGRPGGLALYFKALSIAKRHGYTDQIRQWAPRSLMQLALRRVRSLRR